MDIFSIGMGGCLSSSRSGAYETLPESPPAPVFPTPAELKAHVADYERRYAADLDAWRQHQEYAQKRLADHVNESMRTPVMPPDETGRYRIVWTMPMLRNWFPAKYASGGGPFQQAIYNHRHSTNIGCACRACTDHDTFLVHQMKALEMALAEHGYTCRKHNRDECWSIEWAVV